MERTGGETVGIDGHDDVAPEALTAAARPWTRRLLLGTCFLGVVLVMLRPSWHSLTHDLPDLGDPVLYGWTWNFTRHQVVTDPLRLFDGNIYFAHPLTVAYTDNMLVLLPPFALLRGLGAGWALQINLLTIGILTGGLAATYSLVRRLVGRADVAMFAAIAYMFSSYTMIHRGHLQLLLLGQFPLGFLLAFRWFEHRRPRDAVLFGLLNVSFFLGALYYAAIWVVCVAVVLVGHLIAVRGRPGPRFVSGLAVIALVSALAVPFVLPYLELDQERPLVPEWGLRIRDLTTTAPGSYLYGGLDPGSRAPADRGEHAYFPGFSTLILAGVGVVALTASIATSRRRRPERDPAPTPNPAPRRREILLVLAAGAASAILALGPGIDESRPFAWVHEHVPGFSGIRVAGRLAVPALLAGAVLAALGLRVVLDRLRPRVALAVAAVACVVLVAELLAPITTMELPTDRARLAVYHALTERPAGAVVELPMADPYDGARWATIEAPRMLASTIDLHPRLNGYSGGFPDDYLDRRAALDPFPDATAIRAARRLHLRYVILHTEPVGPYAQYTAEQAATMVGLLPPDVTARRYGTSWLIDLGPPRT